MLTLNERTPFDSPAVDTPPWMTGPEVPLDWTFARSGEFPTKTDPALDGYDPRVSKVDV